MNNLEKTSAAKRILVVDDDDAFRGALSNTLDRQGYRITEAPDGRVAILLLGAQEVDLVISDIEMPGINGVELLNLTKKIRPQLPFILMTGFSHLKEVKEAYDLGARGFLPKPFKMEELERVMQRELYPQITTFEEDHLDLRFCKISIDDFVSGREIQYDIYVRISEKKYLKIAHQG